MAAELTEKEAEIYDRQIRLWGVEAQRRMRASRVLISGLNALGTEVAKNIVLAGVSATLHDDTPISETDLGAQFFVRMEHVGTKRATAALTAVRELNPLVDVQVLGGSLLDASDEALRGHGIVILCGGQAAEQLALAGRLRALGVPHIIATLYGFRAVVMQDWLEHTYTAAKPKNVGDEEVTMETKTYSFAPIAAQLAAPLPTKPKRYKMVAGILKSYVAWRAVYTALASGAANQLSGDLMAAALEAARQHAVSSGLRPEGASDDATIAPISAAIDAALVAEFVNGVGLEISPVAAVVGGVVGGEAIKALSGKEAPLAPGAFLFDGMGGSGGVLIQP